MAYSENIILSCENASLIVTVKDKVNFTKAEAIEEVVWTLKIAEARRGINRARIDSLCNGTPPYTDEEVEEGNINTNVNGLSATKITQDARRQFSTAFLNPDPLFTVDVDVNPKWKKKEWSFKIQSEINRMIKRSMPYMESTRNVFAQLVLHGISPSSWKDKYSWCPTSDAIADVLVPSNTLLDLSNLPFLVRHRKYTGAQLWKMTHGYKVDSGWNIPLAEQAVKWVDEQAKTLMMGSFENDWWSPEKFEERIKENGGLYSIDKIPTVDCWDFIYWNDEGKKSGWRRKIILDSWAGSATGIQQSSSKISPKSGRRFNIKDNAGSQFLYDSGDNVYCSKLSETISFQFADCSSVAPFRYHAVRSLGFLIYSVCHLQNRLQCKFNDAVFESLMQYFRVNNMAEAERAIKIDLTDKRALPDGVQFVKPEERWKIDQSIVQMAMTVNRQGMADNSQSFTQDIDFDSGKDETATRTMAKVNAGAAMTSSMLMQAYNYRTFQYQEICRRFCIPNSKDPDVRRFRDNILKQGVPEEVLDFNRWDIQPVRVIGSGNKMLQVAMMDKIMAVYYDKLDPSAQRDILRMGMAVTTDDYDLAQRAVPPQKAVSGSVHDAQVAAGTMLMGLPMDLVQEVNHTEYVEKLLAAMQTRIAQITNSGGVGTQDDVMGLQNIAGESIQGQKLGNNGIASHIQILEGQIEMPNQEGQPQKDIPLQSKIKMYSDALGRMMNEVKAFSQRQQSASQAVSKSASKVAESINYKDAPDDIKRQMEQQAGLHPSQMQVPDPKVQKTLTGIELSRQKHAEKLAQNKVAFDASQAQEQQKHEAELRALGVETAAKIERQNAESESVKNKTVDDNMKVS